MMTKGHKVIKASPKRCLVVQAFFELWHQACRDFLAYGVASHAKSLPRCRLAPGDRERHGLRPQEGKAGIACVGGKVHTWAEDCRTRGGKSHLAPTTQGGEREREEGGVPPGILPRRCLPPSHCNSRRIRDFCYILDGVSDPSRIRDPDFCPIRDPFCSMF
ncbi:hypothetical protein BDA96_06G043500 [Sorghum bicolor]|uniref:Uncharacterized protein n=2 Tax=Sorghum bicolor TaxID=4558 RepID=A0A921UAX4_SORBI|nr:hypothetical protein BDA96_06G043500 [Sorghum bicolor]KXG25987.1 hypothetical protein SORBI_3006G039900 [Sorghum bicolor]